MFKRINTPQSLIFDARASSFDKLKWVTDRDFLGNILEFIYNFYLDYQLDGKKIRTYLDVGTGTGEVLKYFVEYYEKTQKFLIGSFGYGIDVSNKMLEIAKQKLKNYSNIELENMSILNHNLEYNSFDFIICRNSFHHFEDPDTALLEMRKLVKSGGRIFIIEGVAPDNYTLSKWQKILELKDTGRNPLIYLSLENVEDFFKNKFNLNIRFKELTSIDMLLSNWLSNALITDDTKEQIISLVLKLSKNERFSLPFGLKQIKKEPFKEKDFLFKKRSILIEIVKR